MSVPIEQAFTPAREIDDPERFAGRATILNDPAGALGIEGGHIVIFGNRSVGKSSVGRHLEALSRRSQNCREDARRSAVRLSARLLSMRG
jgi:hypothetical protein